MDRKVLAKAGLAVLGWETFWWLWQKAERHAVFAKARKAADAAGKPLLVIGEPDGEYPCGDVTVDIRPTSVCPVYVRTSIEDLSAFKDKTFGAVFVSFLVSYTCAPWKAFSELERVADVVMVVEPKPWRLTSYLIPGRRWLILGKENRRYIQLPWKQCGYPTRYGTPLGNT